MRALKGATAALLIGLLLSTGACAGLGASAKDCGAKVMPSVPGEVAEALRKPYGWAAALVDLASRYGTCVVDGLVEREAGGSTASALSESSDPVEGGEVTARVVQARAREWLAHRGSL